MHLSRRTMAFGIVRTPAKSVALALHTEEPPSEIEWGWWCSLLQSNAESVGWDGARIVNLIVTDGGAPSTAQRTKINNLVAQFKGSPRVGVITSATSVRNISRAFTVFNPTFRVFSPDQRQAAMGFLELGSYQREIFDEMADIEAEQFGAPTIMMLALLRQPSR